MARSGQDSKRSVKVPSLEDWAKAKEREDKRLSRLPFIKKLRILEQMKEIVWDKGRQSEAGR